jgi:hypothetical protein
MHSEISMTSKRIKEKRMEQSQLHPGMTNTKSVTSGDGQDKVSYIREWPRPSQLHPGMAKTKSVTSGEGQDKVSYIRG